jgi:hypothetical protein
MSDPGLNTPEQHRNLRLLRKIEQHVLIAARLMRRLDPAWCSDQHNQHYLNYSRAAAQDIVDLGANRVKTGDYDEKKALETLQRMREEREAPGFGHFNFPKIKLNNA